MRFLCHFAWVLDGGEMHMTIRGLGEMKIGKMHIRRGIKERR